MADSDNFVLPPPNPEHRRIAAGQFERANQVIASGNYDYGIQLLLTCCKLDPANLIYRQALRQTEKAKYKNNMRGSRLAMLTTSAGKAKIKTAKRARDYLKVLEYGEEVLVRNPWDTATQLDMAEAAEALGLLNLAIWTLEQARQKNPKEASVNRSLARLYEKRGNFAEAIQLWDLVRQTDPKDLEAQHKAKDLAATETIARGQYQEVIGKAKPQQAAEPGEVTTPSGRVLKPLGDRLTQETAPLRARLQADPTSVDSYLKLAAVFRRIGQLDKAREVLQQGLGPTGNSYELTIEMADLEIEVFRRDLALTEHKLRENPKDEELRQIRVRQLKEINGRELEFYRQKTDRYPTDQALRLELGIRLAHAGQIDEAIKELQIARSDSRQRWRALMYLGHCFKHRNNWRLAQRNFEEALELLPAGEDGARKDILFRLAQGAAEDGELTRAVEWGLELAHIDFTYRNIGQLLDDWQASLNDGPSKVDTEQEAPQSD